MKRKAAEKAPAKKAPAKKKNVAAKGHKLPDPISAGEILTDLSKREWVMGKSIGQGGFGEIYLASDIINKPVAEDSDYVIKIEPHSNGPLFTEMHCYMRIGKPELIENWKKEKKLKRLGIPKYLGSGSHVYKGQKYRFMVMERFGSDLQKIINKHNKQFSFKTVCEVGRQIIDALEYIHSHSYIHADIKASNLLVGHRPGTQNIVFLVDYGLACKYKIDGKHKEYKFDQRKAHDGTIEFTSRDAHIGAHSRRGDFEILGYNIVQWLCGKLPWEDKLEDCNYVAGRKRECMDDVPMFMKKCFPDGVPPGVQEFMEYVASLTFDECPNYAHCKDILSRALVTRGHKDDGKLVFMAATPKPVKAISKIAARKKASKRRSEEEENMNMGSPPPAKEIRLGRQPCGPRNFISRAGTRLCPSNSPVSLSRVKPEMLKPVYIDPDLYVVEVENQKMINRRLKQRPKRLTIKKDTSLDNPTPQMIELLARIREKSISPPMCTKKHRHSSTCTAPNKPAQEDLPSYMTPAMETIMRKREERLSSESSETEESDLTQEGSYRRGRHRRSNGRRYSTSSDILEEEEGDIEEILLDDDANSSYSLESKSSVYSEDSNFSLRSRDSNNRTMYYSPCGGDIMGNSSPDMFEEDIKKKCGRPKGARNTPKTGSAISTKSSSGVRTSHRLKTRDAVIAKGKLRKYSPEV